ncbi:MAG: hypothetical protein NWE88_12105 [Candidatus Bathyarchaeota archaeon]|nr:hypothetical protein [Candidatus Bathyarchaeota archaeon]
MALLVLSILMFGASASLLSGVWAATLDSELPLEADITFIVYPNGDFEMRAHGTLEQSYDFYQTASPIREMLFSFQGEPVDTDLHSESGSIVFKLAPQYALFLASLDLDIDFHAERLSSETSIQLGFPGMVDLEMSVETISQEGTFEGSVDVEATATIWYSIMPEETISMLVLGFPLFKAEIESQLHEYSDGNLEFSELAIIESELGEVSATITAKMTVEGDFGAGVTAFGESYIPEYMDPPVESSIPPESWTTTMRSGDVHISYDSEDLAFIIEYEAIVEGDVDEQFNSMKDLILEEVLDESDLDPDATRLINSLILPSEVSIVNLGITYNATLDGETTTMEFDVDGLVLKPPSPEALLSFLEEASEGVIGDKLTLTLEGASQGKEYVEIQVPDETTEPLSQEPQKVVWTFADIENLDKVTFEVKETPSSPLNTTLLIPAVGVVAIAAVAIWYFMSKRG